MKITLVIGIYGLIIVSALHNILAWPHKEVFRKDANDETRSVDQAEPRICSNFRSLRYRLSDCSRSLLPIQVRPRSTNSFRGMFELFNMCSTKEIVRKCMLEKIAGCQTSNATIMELVDRGLSYCAGEEIPQDVLNFTLSNKIRVADSCEDAVFDYDRMTSPQCNQSSMPDYRTRGNLVEIAEEADEYYWWHVNCWMSTNLTEIADVSCGNVTRGQVYGYAISVTFPLRYGFGVNHYAKFKAFKLAYARDGLF